MLCNLCRKNLVELIRARLGFGIQAKISVDNKFLEESLSVLVGEVEKIFFNKTS